MVTDSHSVKTRDLKFRKIVGQEVQGLPPTMFKWTFLPQEVGVGLSRWRGLIGGRLQAKESLDPI